MTYKVFISAGKGKNYAQMGSTPLKTKQAVVNWVKRNPVGNSKTQVIVTNIRTNKVSIGSKARFYRVGNWHWKK